MSSMGDDIQVLMTELAAAGQPRPPHFLPTARETIWIGQRDGRAAVILKRCSNDREARIYDSLVGPQSLPAPALLHTAPTGDDEGRWLVLEPVDCTPPLLSPRSATHWWQNARRRDRTMVMLGALHGRFWARPELLEPQAWMHRYTADDFWQALELLERPPGGWIPLSRSFLGQLVSGAEMLIAGPSTLIHGSFHPNNVGWRADSPVLLDWEKVAWGPPFADLGRLFTRLEEVDGRPAPLVPAAWRAPLLAAYATTIEAVANESLEQPVLAVLVRSAMLWELAVDLLAELRAGEQGDRARYERFLGYAEAEADEP